MNREYQAFAEREMGHWPGVTFHVDACGRSSHEKLVLNYQTHSRFLVRPRTPSDRRGPIKHTCDIRRALREMGAIRT